MVDVGLVYQSAPLGLGTPPLMTEVSLTVRNGKNGAPTRLTLQVDESQRGLLEQFLRNVDRLMAAKLLDAFPSVHRIQMTSTEGLTIEISPFAYAEVYELLHLARPFFLKREPASFESTLAFFGRAGAETPLATLTKQIRRLYERGEYQPFMSLSVSGIELFQESTIEAWLNGTEYHQDPDKAAIIASLEECLTTDVARGIFVVQLSGRLRAILRLAEMVEGVLGQISGRQVAPSPSRRI